MIQPFTLSIAPMIDVTDRHYRFFMRTMTKQTLLYTPMITTGAVLNGKRAELMRYSPEEQPLAFQLGGDDPKALAQSARIAEALGYCEINLNVGCPSDRVQEGNFGACLMATPERVADAISAMKSAVSIPVTVKHRIGIDDLDSYDHFRTFVDTVAKTGCSRFIVHARKAWLKGLSPKQNRTVPPLRYDEVYQLKRERPDLTIVINGGIRSLDEVKHHLRHVDGVMIGRAAYENPYLFANVDRDIFGMKNIAPSREKIMEEMTEYIEAWKDRVPPNTITRHMMGLYHGQPGARSWRRQLATTQLSTPRSQIP